jgi:hypothetical protein
MAWLFLAGLEPTAGIKVSIDTIVEGGRACEKRDVV